MSIKQLAVVVFTLCLIPCVLRADLGLPHIQAVCQVTLKDGTTVEGVVLVATGGYLLKFDNYGFLIVVDKPKNEGAVRHARAIEVAALFDLTFRAIQPYNGIVETLPLGQTGWGRWFRKPKVYFLRDVTYKTYFANNFEITSEYDSTGLPILLKRDLIDHRVYELLEYVPIYTRVPEELYLTREIESVEELRIKVESIERFALVHEPSQSWLDEIAEIEKAFKETHDMFEILLPWWWHDILEKQELFKDKFKKWYWYP